MIGRTHRIRPVACHALLGMLMLSCMQDPFYSALLQKTQIMVIIRLLVVPELVYSEIVIKELFRLGIHMICASHKYFYLLTYNLMKDMSFTLSQVHVFYKTVSPRQTKIGIGHVLLIFVFLCLLLFGLADAVKHEMTRREIVKVSCLSLVSMLLI